MASSKWSKQGNIGPFLRETLCTNNSKSPSQKEKCSQKDTRGVVKGIHLCRQSDTLFNCPLNLPVGMLGWLREQATIGPYTHYNGLATSFQAKHGVRVDLEKCALLAPSDLPKNPFLFSYYIFPSNNIIF